MRIAIALLVFLLIAARAGAETYSIALTPEQETMVAVIAGSSSLTVQQYLAQAVASRIQADYGRAAAPVGSKLVEQWPALQSGQRTAICEMVKMSPCPMGAKK